MSRHSKNNTANSVFTYGERKKLKQLNEWGEVTTRIGSDSQKKFEQCNICLKRMEEPTVCNKGHTFCYPCIIENIFTQKKENKRNRELLEEEQRLQSKDNKEGSKLEESFLQAEDRIVEYENENVEKVKERF